MKKSPGPRSVQINILPGEVEGEIKAIGKGANQLRGFLCPGSLIYRKIYERIDNLSKQGRPL